jgi:hypothetical protein
MPQKATIQVLMTSDEINNSIDTIAQSIYVAQKEAHKLFKKIGPESTVDLLLESMVINSEEDLACREILTPILLTSIARQKFSPSISEAAAVAMMEWGRGRMLAVIEEALGKRLKGTQDPEIGMPFGYSDDDDNGILQ